MAAYLINRVATGEASAKHCLQKQQALKSITINTWTISDLDLIGVGAFSPLTGFMNEADYRSVVRTMRLANGTVWSIPITLAVEEAKAAEFSVGERSCACRRRWRDLRDYRYRKYL